MPEHWTDRREQARSRGRRTRQMRGEQRRTWRCNWVTAICPNPLLPEMTDVILAHEIRRSGPRSGVYLEVESGHLLSGRFLVLGLHRQPQLAGQQPQFSGNHRRRSLGPFGLQP